MKYTYTDNMYICACVCEVLTFLSVSFAIVNPPNPCPRLDGLQQIDQPPRCVRNGVKGNESKFQMINLYDCVKVLFWFSIIGLE